MSMQALNQLVARSITDPTVAQAFGAGQIGDIRSDLGFASEMRQGLAAIQAGTFAEFAVLAYRAVKAAAAVPRVLGQGPVRDQIRRRRGHGRGKEKYARPQDRRLADMASFRTHHSLQN